MSAGSFAACTHIHTARLWLHVNVEILCRFRNGFIALTPPTDRRDIKRQLRARQPVRSWRTCQSLVQLHQQHHQQQQQQQSDNKLPGEKGQTSTAALLGGRTICICQNSAQPRVCKLSLCCGSKSEPLFAFSCHLPAKELKSKLAGWLAAYNAPAKASIMIDLTIARNGLLRMQAQ